MILYRLSVFLLFISLSNNCFSLDKIIYNGSNQPILDKNCLFYLDRSCGLEVDQLTNHLKNTRPKYDTLGQCLWQRLSIYNGTQENNIILEFADPHIDKIEIYDASNFKLLYKSGFGISAKERSILHKNHSFNLNISSNSSAVYLIKLKTEVWAGLRASLKPTNQFIGYSLAENISLGVFYGVLLLLLVYNFVLFFTNKQPYYLFYVLYILSSSLISFNEDGLGFLYLWPDKLSLNYFFYRYGSMILCFAFLLYSLSFFGKKILNTKIITSLSAFLLITHFLFYPLEISNLLPLTYSLFYLSILYFTTNKFKNILSKFSFFTIGNIILILSFFILELRSLGILESNVYTVYFFNFGFVMEGIIFSYAMAGRLHSANEKAKIAQQKAISELKEKELLKDKVNRELEIAVVNRTIEIEKQKEELVILNEELKLYQSKLDHINSELDKDNWKLQRSLSVAKKERILKRVSSYEEFCEVFKSNFECSNHLIELKWSESYKCKKCKGKNYVLVPKTSKRKCTTCKHIESPTANTIFHGVKFPLNKAFYLVYHTHYNKKNKTIDELSIELELRRNTLWAFKKKVQERRNEMIANGTIKENSPWESIIG